MRLRQRGGGSDARASLGAAFCSLMRAFWQQQQLPCSPAAEAMRRRRHSVSRQAQAQRFLYAHSSFEHSFYSFEPLVKELCCLASVT